MLHRCYGKAHKSYQGTLVCPEWLTFSNFEKWLVSQKRNNGLEFYVLDKDLLGKDSSVYGPETCCLLSVGLNSMLTLRNSSRGDWPVGVDFVSQKGKYRAQISVLGKKKYIGLFDTPEAAHRAWQKEKAQAFEEYLTVVVFEDYRVQEGIGRVLSNLHHDIKHNQETKSLFEERDFVR